VGKIPQLALENMDASPTDFRVALLEMENKLLSRNGNRSTSPQMYVEVLRATTSLAFARVQLEVSRSLSAHLSGARPLKLNPDVDAAIDGFGAPKPSDNRWSKLRTQWLNAAEKNGNIPGATGRHALATYDDARIIPWRDLIRSTQLAALTGAADGSTCRIEVIEPLIALYNESSERRGSAADAYLTSVSDRWPPNVPALRYQAKLAYFTTAPTWKTSALDNAEGNANLMMTMLLGVHRWATKNQIGPEQESHLVLSKWERFRIPANLKPDQLARLGWPTANFGWNALDGIVVDDGNGSFAWRNVAEIDVQKVDTYCAALFTKALSTEGGLDPIELLVRLGDKHASSLIYPFSVEDDSVVERHVNPNAAAYSTLDIQS